LKLSSDQEKALLNFAEAQVGVGKYTFFSLKKPLLNFIENRKIDHKLIHTNWHCASFVWFAFYDLVGVDLDANGGECIFPNDIINSSTFNQPDGRMRF
jgi:uncharacterized protein YycO